ncbi:MAG: CRISPR-associated helicase Cas3', partial [Hyphomicrobium sp.]
MLSDWIGSNQTWFAYTSPTLTLDAYWEITQVRAKIALSECGLSNPRIAAGYSLTDALPGVVDPTSTPLQTWAANDANVTGQSLIVIEDLTGAGKTEAGLILAHQLMRAGAAEGLYWALPTMATADALYRRLAESYSKLFENPAQTSLVLAHSSREFNDIFKKSIELGSAKNEYAYSKDSQGPSDSDITATAACSRWIADDRRKTFLADVGVGTIDQAVLGILPSKHQAMRLAALCRRVLVIDEIHALDAYQNSLVETLLEFHAALGGSAVLMSATLTLAGRQRLAGAFAKGAGWPAPKLAEQHFPLATVVDHTGHRERRLDAGRGTRRDLPVHRLENAGAAIAILEQAALDGRAAVWVRNTVQDALDAYRDLRARLPNASIDLFHARFALGDRLNIEQRVLQSFGKKSSGIERQRILIATQVVEQSLDCDWDIMISDLAPIDLIIQRAGRLHRHERGERPSPVLHIVGPEPADDAGAKWYETAFPRGAFVYPHHGQLWLTMKSLLDARGLNLASGSPRDLIERVYAEDAEFPPGLMSPSGKAEGRAASARGIGRMNALDRSKGYVHQAGAWESDTRTPTRLGDPTRALRLAKWDGQHLEPWFAVENCDTR